MRSSWRWMGLLALALGCSHGSTTSSVGGEALDGETNWLAGCETDTDCAMGACICGICTKTCDTVEDCVGDFAGGCALAQAVAADVCPTSLMDPTRICLPACGVGRSCGRGYQCVSETCVPENEAPNDAPDGGACVEGGARVYEDPVVEGTAGFSAPTPSCGLPRPDFNASANAYGGPPEAFEPSGPVNCAEGGSFGFTIDDGTCFSYASCELTCESASDCPSPGSGTAEPACVDGTCLLPCTDAACADGMVCVPETHREPPLGDVCMWPYPRTDPGCPCDGAESPRDCVVAL